MTPPEPDPARRIDDLLSGAWVLAALARAADSGDPLDPELGRALGAAGCAEHAPEGWRLLPEYRRLAAAPGRAREAGLSARLGRMLRWAADAAEDRPPQARPHTDDELRAEGDESGRRFAELLDALAAADREMAAVLAAADVRFLDVGTGTAAIAAAVAERGPGVRAVGVDRDAHALALAAERIDRRGLGGRVRLARRDAVEIADADTDADVETDAFDLAWLPLGALAPDAVRAVLPRLRAALRTGGTLVAATVLKEDSADGGDGADSPDGAHGVDGAAGTADLGQALARWRMSRAGITTWGPAQTARHLREAGFTAVRTPALPDQPLAVVLARAP